MKKIIFSLLSSLTVTVFCSAAEPYQLLHEIAVGGEGGWDYLTVDSAAQRLYVSHGNKLVMINLATDAVVGEITNTPGIHGLALAPELNRGLATCGRENKGAIVDLKTSQILSKVDTGANPDAMLFEPGQKEFYTFNGRGESATVIDAKSGKIVTTIPLSGKPEFATTDMKAGRVFTNIEDKNQLVAIDTTKHEIVNRWPIVPGEEPSGLAFDAKNHRLFLGCRNKLMVMMDSDSGRVLASVPIGAGVDANAFDPETQLAFASCSDGTVTIAHEDSEKLTVVQTLKTEKGARTMALDPTTHKIYLPSAKFEEPAAGQQRGKMIPGSFKILVFGQRH
jgi:DNA-binding beta-propeller fold protein YncE